MTNDTALNDSVLFQVCSACSPRQQDNRVCSTTLLYIVKVKKHFIREADECGRDSVVRIATRLRDGRFGVRIPTEVSLKRSDILWGPLSLLFDGYRGSFPGAKRTKRTTHVNLMPRLRTSGVKTHPPPPICHYGGEVWEAPCSSGHRDCHLP